MFVVCVCVFVFAALCCEIKSKLCDLNVVLIVVICKFIFCANVKHCFVLPANYTNKRFDAQWHHAIPQYDDGKFRYMCILQ